MSSTNNLHPIPRNSESSTNYLSKCIPGCSLVENPPSSFLRTRQYKFVQMAYIPKEDDLCTEISDWTQITNPRLRKRVQNRLSQRKHRRNSLLGIARFDQGTETNLQTLPGRKACQENLGSYETSVAPSSATIPTTMPPPPIDNSATFPQMQFSAYPETQVPNQFQQPPTTADYMNQQSNTHAIDIPHEDWTDLNPEDGQEDLRASEWPPAASSTNTMQNGQCTNLPFSRMRGVEHPESSMRPPNPTSAPVSIHSHTDRCTTPHPLPNATPQQWRVVDVHEHRPQPTSPNYYNPPPSTATAASTRPFTDSLRTTMTQPTSPIYVPAPRWPRPESPPSSGEEPSIPRTHAMEPHHHRQPCSRCGCPGSASPTTRRRPSATSSAGTPSPSSAGSTYGSQTSALDVLREYRIDLAGLPQMVMGHASGRGRGARRESMAQSDDGGCEPQRRESTTGRGRREELVLAPTGHERWGENGEEDPRVVKLVVVVKNTGK